ncbi:MAG: Bax inhibitor-1/YccA family protein [Deltaproteobacteria bacterium]|jgi:FtsH-binding integral membrane protein|nr:Bax inhibitor-1/YccA family protein [Deltaproteobacteria bacterium]
MFQTKQRTSESIVSSKAITNAFLRGVYAWMTAGLALTAATAWFVAHSETVLDLLFNGGNMPFYILLAAQLGIVIALSSAVHKMSAGLATFMFMLYSALTGITFSVLLLAYAYVVVTKAFIVAAGTFAAFSVYGLVTKRDLTSLGSFMTVGLIGVLIAMLINIFTNSPALDYAISVIGVVVFLGLTAFDTQKLRAMGESAPLDDAVALRRGTIRGALTLYLDFINLFLFLLRLFGNRR